jgi:hypothetical protein
LKTIYILHDLDKGLNENEVLGPKHHLKFQEIEIFNKDLIECLITVAENVEIFVERYKDKKKRKNS